MLEEGTRTFAPLADEDWPESIGHLRGTVAGRLNVYRTMAHHPALLAAWEPLRNHVVKHTALGKTFNEIVILRALGKAISDTMLELFEGLIAE